MNISPINFGKIVLVEGPRKVAGTIMHYANTPSVNALDKKFKKEVNKVFNDTKKGSAEVWIQPDGFMYIFSGKDSLQLHNCLRERENAVVDVWKEYQSGEMHDLMLQTKAEVCVDKIQDLIEKNIEPYAISIDYDENKKMHLSKII